VQAAYWQCALKYGPTPGAEAGTTDDITITINSSDDWTLAVGYHDVLKCLVNVEEREPEIRKGWDVVNSSQSEEANKSRNTETRRIREGIAHLSWQRDAVPSWPIVRPRNVIERDF
jgi:hypothetical protein